MSQPAHANTHTRTHTHTHTHTNTHTHTHTHTHTVRRPNLKSLVVVLFVEVSFQRSFEGMGGLNATDVRRERIPLLWSTLEEAALAKGFGSNVGDTKYPSVCTKLLLYLSEHG